MFWKAKFCIIPYIYKGMYASSGLNGLMKKFDWAFTDHMWCLWYLQNYACIAIANSSMEIRVLIGVELIYDRCNNSGTIRAPFY